MVKHIFLCYNTDTIKMQPYIKVPKYKQKGENTMAPSEAQKKASAKYQKENIASLACRVKKEQADKFKAYCEAQGKTPNAVLREYVLSCINDSE